MLTINKISKTFNKNTIDEKVAIDNLSLTLDKGDFVTIIGGNGAGKSTLFNSICGGFFVDSGQIILDKKDITYLKDYKRAKEIGVLFQDPLKGSAPNMTIEENLSLCYSKSVKKSPLSYATSKKNRSFFKEHLSRLGLGLEDRMTSKVGLLSGGQRQALTLLMATIVTPKLLLLDEHTAALDPKTSEKVMQVTKDIVNENNLTCLMITHNIKQALETGNRTIMLDKGKVLLDIKGHERNTMTVDDILFMFKEKTKTELDDDNILLV